MHDYKYFKVEISNKIAHVAFNRPDKANALTLEAWEEMQQIFDSLSDLPEARVIILSGEGKHFCAGIDLSLLMSLQQNSAQGEGRKQEQLRQFILKLQACITSIEHCQKPVIAAIHKGCIGGGVDIATACDLRYCTSDAYFTIKEIDMGLVADIGTMQRLPHIIGAGMMAEMAYTGRKMMGAEAQQIGLVNKVFADKASMLEQLQNLATDIAAKSPLVVRGTKRILRYTRDHSVADSLDYIATWNAAMLVSDDLMEAFQASIERRPPVFKD
ncbi:MAG: crotonase/enoyl-CoA hydratase family protein [Bacteroidota bacterium]